MITVIHGDDIVSSRNFLHKIKSDISQSVSFEGKKVTVTDLVQELEGGSLFGGDKTLFIEELLSGRKGKDVTEITSYLKDHADLGTIYVWESKQLGKRDMDSFGRVTDQSFTIPKTLFSFLDAIAPASRQGGPQNSRLLSLYHALLKSVEPELVFFMITRHFRILLTISDESGDTIDEAARLAPWQKSKLERQSRLFSTKELKDAHQKLFQIDLATKTGGTPLSLSQSIDFFLLDL
jgi:DNA polymerase III delta subunit